MSGFGYRDDALTVDGVRLDTLAEAYGTPLYVYAGAEIRRRYLSLLAAFSEPAPEVFYALKANPTLGVVALLAREGAGADVVSVGELERALVAGVPPERIVFAGVGKSRYEIDRALEVGILQFNVEAIEELRVIAAAAAAAGVEAPVALRLNPDVAASTHDKITTGRRDDKFGIAGDRLDEALDAVTALGALRLVGLHCHIGSQVTALDDFERAYLRMAEFWRHCRERGFRPRRLNLGGGMGVRYVDEAELDLDAFASMVRRVTADLDAMLGFEPGRFLVAAAGRLVSRVIRIKSGSHGRCFVVLDAGMNTLLRPALYDAVHRLVPVVRQRDAASIVADVVGPICESSDVFLRNATLPPLVDNDLVALTDVGAYGATMAADYNSRGRPGEVLVDTGVVTLLKPPVGWIELAANETIPEHLVPGADREQPRDR